MRRRSGAARDTFVLAVGSTLNGLLAYVFFAIVTRALGADAAAPVSVLWAYWSFAAAALAFPLQHWAARTVTMTGSDHQVQRSLPAISVAVLTLSPLIGVLAWVAREPLFHRGDLWFPLLVVGSTVGSALSGLVRGMLQAHDRFGAVATSLVLENLVRVVASLVLVAAGVHNPVAYGFALVVGYVTGLVWPWALRMTLQGEDHESPLALLGAASGGQLLGQIVLTGGPVLLALAGGAPAEVTVLFAGLALFRAPYTLAIGMVAQLTARFTRMVVDGQRHALARTRSSLVVATVVLGLLAAPVGAIAGPDHPPARLRQRRDAARRPLGSAGLGVHGRDRSADHDPAPDRARPDHRPGACLAGRGRARRRSTSCSGRLRSSTAPAGCS